VLERLRDIRGWRAHGRGADGQSGAHSLRLAARAVSKRLEKEYSDTVGYSTDLEARRAHLARWFKSVGAGVVIEPTFKCDYGRNISVGDNFYANFDCCILDCAPVAIGAYTFFGPGVHLYAATHPLDSAARRGGESAHAITIGRDCWLGGRVVVCSSKAGGLSIGDGCVIGAGSVVTRSIPPYSLAIGSPARVIRSLK
jgi:maltose O-acetyltransferase